MSTLNAKCFQSLCEDCADLARDHGYEDLSSPEHPLRDELDALTPEERTRIGVFIHGVTVGSTPIPVEEPRLAPELPDITPAFRAYLWLLFLLGLTVALIALYRYLNQIP